MEEEEMGKTKAKTKEEIEVEISQAMRARVEDFKKQADSLTLEGVRRALEKDLGMKAFSLDVHKRFIKQCLEKFFYGPEDESISKSSEKLSVEADQTMNEEGPVKSKNLLSEETGNDSSILKDKSLGSPAFAESEPSDNGKDKDQDIELNEDIIRKAIKERADHFRANSETITLSGVRRILEGDLKLARNTLDAYKSFISHELDEVLMPPESANASNGGKKKDLKKSSQGTDSPRTRKGSKRARKSSDSSDSDDASGDEETEEVVRRPKKKVAKEPNTNTKENVKKKSQEESRSTSSKKKKSTEPDSDKNPESDSEGSSEEGGSRSSEEGSKKKEKPTQSVYGKQVEHLKSIIKSCGMSVPPSVYRRAKQAPESKREAYLIKELEDILDKEGLSTNPSEKEIKAVKRKKERAKELEGIDMSNIVSSTRRRTTSSYIPPPKPKVVVESEDDDEEEGDDEEDEEDEEDAENEEDTDDGNDDGGESSEASDEGGEDESD